MAYDQNGNWYFDPADPVDQEKLQDAREQKVYGNILDQEMKAFDKSKSINQAWIKALEQAGISQETYNKIFSEDEEGATELIKNAMAGVAKTIASKKKTAPQKDPRTGQFVKGPAPTTPDIEKAKENKDADAVLEALFSDDDPIFKY